MALPNNPMTRVESYLNRIASGSGDIPEYPMTRMEQYLDYIAENGGGNVPDPETTDIGKVLGIVADGTGAKYAPVEGSVPDPEVSDIGKVLGIVVDGTGAKYAPVEGGSSGDFIVTFGEPDDVVVSDKTYAEIEDALGEGKNVVGMLYGMRLSFNAVEGQFELYLVVDEVISVNTLKYISDSGNKWMPGGIELDMTPFEVGVLIDPQTGAISVTKSNASIYDAWMKGKSVWLNVPGIDARMLLEKAPTEDFAMFSHTYSDLDPSQDTMKRIEGYIRTTNGVQTCTVRALTWNATQFNPLGGSEA